MHKKILTVLSVSSSLLATSYANDIEPTKEFYSAVRRGAAPVVIDGNLNEWTGVPVLSDPRFAVRLGQEGTAGGKGGGGADGNYVLFERLSGGDWTGPDDHTSAVEVVWDADAVYVAVTVTDEYHEHSNPQAWNGDSVQLMIANATRSGSQGVDFFLYNFGLAGLEGATTDVIIEHEARPAGAPDVEAAIVRDSAAKKTYYEIKIPVGAMGLTGPLTANSKFGLGMAINDGDELTPGQRGWGGLGAHSIVFGKTPSETALVTLADQAPGTDSVFLSALNGSLMGFSFRATDNGTSIIDPASAKLLINGAPVTLTASPKSGGSIDFTYTRTTPFPSGSSNSYGAEIKDTSGQIINASGSFITPQYTSLAASDKVTPDTTKRGFMFTVHQNGALTQNSYARASAQLAGSLGENFADPGSVGPALAAAAAPATPNAPITFEIASTINMNIDTATPLGNDLNDTGVPGAPGTGTAGNDGIAADILTFVELTQGFHTLIVNSDDGFRTFVGKINDVLDRSVAGEFDLPGGRGATDTAFQVYVPENGVYALRTVWHQGGGGGNIEILEQLANGTKVLLNDDVAGGPKTYRAATGASLSGTAVTSITPTAGATGVNGGGAISAVITEGADTVDLATVKLRIDGNIVSATATRTGNTISITYTPTAPLTPGVMHTAGLDFTAGGVARAETWSFKTHLFGPGTLFIEAEDWNFEHGKYVTDVAIGMTGPYAGGAYQDKGDGVNGAACDGSDFGIDYNDNNNIGNDGANVYRPGTPMEASKLGGSAGVSRGSFDVEINHVVGWTGTDEWMNYTRDFPTTGVVTYNVYARMAHGGAAVDRRGGILYTVQGDTTACATTGQTTTELGRFDAPMTGGWDSWPDAGLESDAIIPMRDPSGAKIVVRLSGKQTLRWQFALNAGDLDYIAFVPVAEPIAPKIVTISPAAGASGLGGQPPFSATLQNGEAATIASATLKVDGTTVPVTFTSTATGATVSYTPTTSFAKATSHTYLFSYTDSLGVTREATIPFTISHNPFPAGTLFIEAEDFNFSQGEYDTTNPIGMTGVYPGGTYQNLGDGIDGAPCEGTDYGIDYNDAGTNEADTKYRPATRVAAGKRNGPAGLNRQLFNVQVNHVVGWTGGAEWMNYTRDFPAGNQTYKVFIRMARDGGTRGGILSKLVSGDPTLCDDQQVFEELGRVSGPGTGGWDVWPDAGTDADALLKLKDATGEDALIKLSGKQTLRFQYANDAGDIDYIAFLPQGTVLPPKVLSLSPVNNTSSGGAFSASLQDGDATVSTVTLTLNGATVTPTITKTGNITTVKYAPAADVAAGSQNTYVLTVTDSTGGTLTRTSAFRGTFTPLPAGTVFIEAEDFNFEKGKYVTDQQIGMNGVYAGGAYQGKGSGLDGADCDGSDFGVDYHENNAINDQNIYRPGTSVEAGKRNNATAGLYRGTFDVQVNHIVGWTSAEEWMNYTRDFPATPTTYKVFARMAHGGTDAEGNTRGGVLFKVNGDTALCADPNQTTEQLGTFQAPTTGGWDTWPDAGTPADALIPMKDAAGAVATVTLSGKTTLRFQYADNAGDIDYLAFVPAGPIGPRFLSVVRNANGSITVTWEGNGTLETTPALGPNAVWTPVTGATSPFTFTPAAGTPMLFARIRQ